MRKKKYPWDIIENLYVTGEDDVTLQSLHDEFLPQQIGETPALGSLKRHCSSGDWSQKRRQFRDQKLSKMRNQAMDAQVDLRMEQLKLGEWLRKMGFLSLRDLMREVKAGVTSLTPRFILDVIELGTRLEKQALGMPDIRMENMLGGENEQVVIEILARATGLSESELIEMLEEAPADEGMPAQ